MYIYIVDHMEVSENGGTRKSSILIGSINDTIHFHLWKPCGTGPHLKRTGQLVLEIAQASDGGIKTFETLVKAEVDFFLSMNMGLYSRHLNGTNRISWDSMGLKGLNKGFCLCSHDLAYGFSMGFKRDHFWGFDHLKFLGEHVFLANDEHYHPRYEQFDTLNHYFLEVFFV